MRLVMSRELLPGVVGYETTAGLCGWWMVFVLTGPVGDVASLPCPAVLGRGSAALDLRS
jgi:hypothetical protein